MLQVTKNGGHSIARNLKMVVNVTYVNTWLKRSLFSHCTLAPHQKYMAISHMINFQLRMKLSDGTFTVLRIFHANWKLLGQQLTQLPDGEPINPPVTQENQIQQACLIDYYDTSKTKLIKANHEPGPKCRCSECEHLKSIEDSWIIKLGTFYEHGLNTRNEIKARSRDGWT